MSADCATPMRALSSDEANAAAEVVAELFETALLPCLPALLTDDDEEEEDGGAAAGRGGSDALIVSRRWPVRSRNNCRSSMPGP